MAIHYDTTNCVGDLEELRNETGDMDGLFLFCVTMMVTGTGDLDSGRDVERFIKRYAAYLLATGDSHESTVGQLCWARTFARKARGIKTNIMQEDNAWFADRIVTWTTERASKALKAANDQLYASA